MTDGTCGLPQGNEIPGNADRLGSITTLWMLLFLFRSSLHQAVR